MWRFEGKYLIIESHWEFDCLPRKFRFQFPGTFYLLLVYFVVPIVAHGVSIVTQGQQIILHVLTVDSMT